MFPILLITIISIRWVARLWCCVALHDWSLLHCSHTRYFRLLPLHFQPLFARIDQCRFVEVVVSGAATFRARLAVARSVAAVLPVRSSRPTRSPRHFTLIVRDALAARTMTSAGSWVVWRLTLNRAGTLSLARRCVAVSRWSRPHRLWARVDSKQTTLLTFRPASTTSAARWVGSTLMTELVNRIVIVEACGNTACRSISAVNAVEWRQSLEFNITLFGFTKLVGKELGNFYIRVCGLRYGNWFCFKLSIVICLESFVGRGVEVSTNLSPWRSSCKCWRYSVNIWGFLWCLPLRSSAA